MASDLYDSYKQDLLDRALAVDYDTNNIDCALVLVTAGYTFSAAHDFRNDLTNVVAAAADADFASKTVTGGVADAADLTYTAPTSGTVEALVIYKDTALDSTDNLIAYIDGFSSLVTNGSSDATVQWDDGANRIFAF